MPKQKWLELFRQAAAGAEKGGLAGDKWLEEEILGSAFSDQRLGKRFCRLTGQLTGKLGQSISLACQDWSSVKAAYRFLSNPRVDEGAILAGHFAASRQRVQATEGPLLAVHDTTQFTYARESRQAIGVLHWSYAGYGQDGRPRLHTVCGVRVLSVVLRKESGDLLAESDQPGNPAQGGVADEIFSGRRSALIISVCWIGRMAMWIVWGLGALVDI